MCLGGFVLSFYSFYSSHALDKNVYLTRMGQEIETRIKVRVGVQY